MDHTLQANYFSILDTYKSTLLLSFSQSGSTMLRTKLYYRSVTRDS